MPEEITDDDRSEAVAVTDGARYLQEKLRDRLGILSALLRAIDQFDHVSELMLSSKDAVAARLDLMSSLRTGEAGATAVADLQLLRLAEEEHRQPADEQDNLAAAVADLESLLSSPDRVRESIGTERGDFLAGQIRD